MCPIKVVNLGDEIGVAAPKSFANDTSFELYCKQHAISLDMLGTQGKQPPPPFLRRKAYIASENRRFAKTGSGQNTGKLKKESAVVCRL
jgi:hypothetical protein